jgi:hypothetical protein
MKPWEIAGGPVVQWYERYNARRSAKIKVEQMKATGG